MRIVTDGGGIAQGAVLKIEIAATDTETAQDHATGEGTAIENVIGAGTAHGAANTDGVTTGPSLAETASQTKGGLVHVRVQETEDGAAIRGAGHLTRLRRGATEQSTIDTQYQHEPHIIRSRRV